jgi:hypothetical protein
MSRGKRSSLVEKRPSPDSEACGYSYSTLTLDGLLLYLYLLCFLVLACLLTGLLGYPALPAKKHLPVPFHLAYPSRLPLVFTRFSVNPPYSFILFSPPTPNRFFRPSSQLSTLSAISFRPPSSCRSSSPPILDFLLLLHVFLIHLPQTTVQPLYSPKFVSDTKPNRFHPRSPLPSSCPAL